MKIYLIKFNHYGYDEYDGFVVQAENEDSAVDTLHKEYDETKGVNYKGEPYGLKNNSICWEKGYRIEEIKDDGTAKILLGSFNAG